MVPGLSKKVSETWTHKTSSEIFKARANFESHDGFARGPHAFAGTRSPHRHRKSAPVYSGLAMDGENHAARQGYEECSDLVSAKEDTRSRARKHIQSCARMYIQYQLGRSNDNTFLTELSPIPAAKTTDQSFMSWFRENDTELEVKITRRRDELNRMLKENPQSLVICYGYGNGGDRAHEFAKFLGVEWQSVPGCPGVCRSGDSSVCCCHSLATAQMSYAVFVDMIRSGLLGQS